MANLLLVGLAVLAQAEFKVINPALHADVMLDRDQAWHLGGFCVGHGPDVVAQLVVNMEWHGSEPLPETGETGVYMAAFIGMKNHWDVVQATWETTSCQEKLHSASDFTRLTNVGHTKFGPTRNAFSVAIKDTTATRDWHFALLSCGPVEQARLDLEVEGVGVRSIFQAGSHFDESSCPVVPVDWWKEAVATPALWVVLGALMLGSCLFGFTMLQICRRKVFARKTEVVMGKPCVAPENAVVFEGHPNTNSKVVPV